MISSSAPVYALLRFRYLAPLLIILGVGAVYASTLGHAFHVLDESIYIYKNAAVLEFSFRTIKHIFTHFDPELYVPLTVLTYQIEHLLFGLNPFFYHLTNLILHSIVSFLVYRTLKTLKISPWVACAVALVFALHPLNTETVAWISARKDLLSTMWSLGSFSAFLAWRRSHGRWLILSALLFLCALLSKVSAAPLPLLFVFLLLSQGQSLRDSRVWKPLLPFFILSTVFVLVALVGKEQNVHSLPVLSTFLLLVRSIAFALQQFFWPFDLAFLYPYSTPVSLSSDILLSFIVVAFVGFIIFHQLRRSPLVSIGLFWYLLFYFPMIGTFVRGGEVYLFADRYSYLPMFGLLLALASVVEDALKRVTAKRNLVFTLIIVLCVLGAATYQQSLIWKNDEVLYKDTLARYPNIKDFQYNLALLYDEQARYDEAIHRYEKALAIDPAFAKALNAYGYLTLRIGDTNEAIDLLERSVRADPLHYRSYINLGRAYGKAERYEEGVAAFMKAIELDPVGEDLNLDILLNTLKNAQ